MFTSRYPWSTAHTIESTGGWSGLIEAQESFAECVPTCHSSVPADANSNQIGSKTSLGQINVPCHEMPTSSRVPQIKPNNTEFIDLEVGQIPAVPTIAMNSTKDIRFQFERVTSGCLSSKPAFDEQKKKHKQKGRRQGSLAPDKAKKACEMRRIRACLHCWLAKTQCTKGEVCEKCMWPPKMCTRNRLDDYTDLFFPPFLTSSLKKSEVCSLTSGALQQFTTNKITVTVTWWTGTTPGRLKLNVAEFIPSSLIPTTQMRVDTTNGAHSATFNQSYPAPFALQEFKMDELIRLCRRTIDKAAKDPFVHSFFLDTRTKEMCKRLFESIRKFHDAWGATGNAATLNTAMLLLPINYFMGRKLQYESSDYVIEAMRSPITGIWDASRVSQLLNRQLKAAMNKLLRKLTRDVLEKLQKDLSHKSKSNWASSFCTSIILCFCMEEAQIASNGFIVHQRNDDSMDATLSSTEVIEACKHLDDSPFRHLVELFHGVHKYNPFRDNPEGNIRHGLDSNSRRLVHEIRGIFSDFGSELRYKAQTPFFDCGHDELDQHMAFRDRHSTRLVCSFLLSFIE